jgi:hypothetical protein
MSKYQQQNITGEEYTRCNVITIVNPLNKTPSIQFNEERITVLSDRVLETPIGQITIAFDASKEIVLLNPQTGEPVGKSITHLDLYVALYSAYIASATARDAAQAEEAANP